MFDDIDDNFDLLTIIFISSCLTKEQSRRPNFEELMKTSFYLNHYETTSRFVFESVASLKV